MKISPARTAAFDILLKVETKGAFSSVLLPEFESRLGVKDRALCHELTLGVLRRQIFLDAIIETLSNGPKLDPEIRIVLRLGLFQLIHLDRVPAHSAVNDSVELAVRARRRSAKGMVNAVLRRYLRDPFSPSANDGLDGISLSTSHPRWLIEKWADQFGAEETRLLAMANNVPPRISFRIISGAEPGDFLDSARKSEIAASGYLTDRLTPAVAAAADRGEIYFQDEGSLLVGEMIALDSGGKFLDVCAAPGSKFSQIAAGHRGKGCLLIAGDIHLHRLTTLRKICKHQGINNPLVVQYDARDELPFPEGSFDAILLDAPCSGTGTIRHNPEIRYRLKPEDIIELARKQRSILQKASKLLKKGGSLVYSTCSLENEENEGVVGSFLAGSPDFSRVKREAPRDQVYLGDFVRLLPHKHGTDGFFIARLTRN